MARFKLADVEREKADDLFEVEGSDGTVYTLPHPSDLPVGRIFALNKAMADKDEAAMTAALLGDDFGHLANDPLFTGRALTDMTEGYSKHYGLPDQEKAPASPRSSSGTARRSKPTSRSTSRTPKRS